MPGQKTGLLAVVCFLLAGIAAPANGRVHSLVLESGAKTISLGRLNPDHIYSLSFHGLRPVQLVSAADFDERRIASPVTFNQVAADIIPPKTKVRFRLELAGSPPIVKSLHAGDPGIFLTFQPRGRGKSRVVLEVPEGVTLPRVPFSLQVQRLNLRREDAVMVEREPNDSWEQANPMSLGRTVFAGADDIEYLYNTEEGKNGWDWYTFTYDGAPKLVFFEIDLLDRDIPCTLKIYKVGGAGKDAKPAEYREGQDPTEIRHDDQNDALLNYKFVTRVLTPGTYYVAVKGNHPAYTLRTALYDVPPYTDPRLAARVAMRYMVDGGDSFFHNTPRKGATRTRAENVTDETERCITCHPAHFTMLSTLTAAQNGYPIVNKPQFKFMMDKLYNAMAPFYGFPDTYWLRFELAPTNGISRLGAMLSLYEKAVSHRPTDFPQRALGFPRLVYEPRDELPKLNYEEWYAAISSPEKKPKTRSFEYDGNRPISDFRVATDTWIVADTVARYTGRPEHLRFAEHMKALLTRGTLKDLEDIVEQTKGMVYTGDPAFRERIRVNVEEIFRRQHDDGGWVTAEYMSNEQFFDAAARAPLEKKSDPSLQFMTAQAVYTLHLAGAPAGDPRLQKAVKWLLAQQRHFGAWLDNKGELFLTPYLETKWALIALSSLYPEKDQGPGQAGRLVTPAKAVITGKDLAATLGWLDSLWYQQPPGTARIILPLLESPEPLVRFQAAAALGKIAVDVPERSGLEVAVEPLAKRLADPVKMVSRASAWALRQLANNGIGADALSRALDAPDELTRRGATRVFAQYFYHLTGRDAFAEALLRRVEDADPLVRIQALKALWRWWYRSENLELRNRIADAFIARAAVQAEDPLVRLNVAQALYNILDENTVQFHSNWLRVMARKQDRVQAEQARQQQVEKPLARRLAAALRSGNPTQQNLLLTAFNYFFLRGGIGNDYDFITFYNREAAQEMARALLPLMNSADGMLREKALRAAAIARQARDPELVLAMLKALGDSDPAFRQVAQQVLAKFPADYRQGVQVAARDEE